MVFLVEEIRTLSKKQDIVGGVRVWSIIYMINSNGTPPTMCRIISSKNKKINEKTRHRFL